MKPAAVTAGYGRFLGVWTGELVSLLGSSLSSFGLATWVFTETRSPAAMASLIFWKYLTQIYLSLFAGHLVDRWPKRRLLLVSNLGMLAVSVGLILAFTDGKPALRTLYVAMALMGVFDSLKSLSLQTLMSEMIRESALARFNGIISMFESLPPVLGPPLAAVLLKVLGVQTLLRLDAASFLLALAAIIGFLPRRNTVSRPKPSAFSNLAFGFQKIVSDRSLLQIQLFFTVQNFLGGLMGGLVTAFVLTRSSGDQTTLATVAGMMGLAALLGGVFQSTFPRERALVLFIVALTALGSLTGRVGIAFGASSFAWGLGFGLRSFVNPIVSACNQTYWQKRIEKSIQGRVFGARRVLGQGLYPLAVGLGASLSASWFTDDIAPRWLNGSATGPGAGLSLMFLAVGSVELAFAALWWLANCNSVHSE